MTITQTDAVVTAVTATATGRIGAAAVPVLRSLASTATPATFFDSDITENSNAETWNDFDIQTQIGSSYTLQDLSACQTLTDGVVSPVGAGGLGRVRVSDGVVSKILKCDTTKRGGQTFRAFIEYTAGSVARYLYDQVAPIFDATPDVNYFTTYDHATSIYTRNAACWGASIDLSCVAVASNDGSGWTRQRGGTLITPRHVLIAWHFPYGIGTQLRFVNMAGTVETRTVIGTSYASRVSDFVVCTLNAAVTVATPCPVAGQWMAQGRTVTDNYARWYSGGVAIHTDQNARLYAGTIGQTISQVGSTSFPVTINGTEFIACDADGFVDHSSYGAIPSAYASIRNNPIPGDSGQPCFAVIEGDPVLLWVWHFPHGGPPTYMHNGAVMNALIAIADANAGISTGLTITVAPDPTL